MPVPRPLHHSRGRKQLKPWRLAGALFGIFIGVSLYRSITWTSSVLQEANEDRRLHRMAFPRPVARNGAMIRPQHSIITQYDRQQDIHHYAPVDRPRVVLLTPSSDALSHSPRSVEALTDYDPSLASDPLQHIWGFEEPYHNQCTPMEQWQTEFYPTCNTMHEILPETLLSTKGSWRTVWDIEGPKVAVLKMLNMYRNFDHESFSYHQVDAMAMERLTKSKYMIHSFGFCGQSVLVERARGEGRYLLKSKKFTSNQRLGLARDLARGLSDIHSIDHSRGRNATFCHNDINIANIVAMDDAKIKFNDFNIGYLLKWNETQPCGFPQRWEGKLWRSPEEIRNTSYVSEKIDVYSLGNIYYQILTKHQPWTWLEPGKHLSLDDIAERKLLGKFPYIPKKYTNSTDMAVQAVYQAMRACFRNDPQRRPTAFQLAHGLSKVAKWIFQGKKTKVNISIFYSD